MEDYLKLFFLSYGNLFCERGVYAFLQIVADYVPYAFAFGQFVDFPIGTKGIAFKCRFKHRVFVYKVVYGFLEISQIEYAVKIKCGMYHSVIIISENILDLIPDFSF